MTSATVTLAPKPNAFNLSPVGQTPVQQYLTAVTGLPTTYDEVMSLIPYFATNDSQAELWKTAITQEFNQMGLFLGEVLSTNMNVQSHCSDLQSTWASNILQIGQIIAAFASKASEDLDHIFDTMHAIRLHPKGHTAKSKLAALKKAIEDKKGEVAVLSNKAASFADAMRAFDNQCRIDRSAVADAQDKLELMILGASGRIQLLEEQMTELMPQLKFDSSQELKDQFMGVQFAMAAEQTLLANLQSGQWQLQDATPLVNPAIENVELMIGAWSATAKDLEYIIGLLDNVERHTDEIDLLAKIQKSQVTSQWKLLGDHVTAWLQSLCL